MGRLAGFEGSLATGGSVLEDPQRFREAIERLSGELRGAMQTRALKRSAGRLWLGIQAALSGPILPAVTGEFRASVGIDAAGLPESIEVGTGHPGAEVQHFGWRAHNLKPSPYILEPVDDLLEVFGGIFAEEYLRALEGAAGGV